MGQVLDILREATRHSPYEERLYLVGGIVRDKVLFPDKASDEDIDIVLEGDAGELAAFLHERGIADHAPVTYPRFGTAMITVAGRQVELVSARSESYDPASRKPDTQPATLAQDVLRRDFTINTLLENLHTGEVRDLTGQAFADMERRTIRTPLDPGTTFEDDPLRMLRAVRFAARLGFDIHAQTWAAIRERAHRLEIVSAERIRDEFVKIVAGPGAARGLEMLRETGLLDRFAPELSTMHGVAQNIYHVHDVWTHTLETLEALPHYSRLSLRLAALFHDTGKVETRTVDEQGLVHFYSHQTRSAEIARRVMARLRFPHAETDEVVFLVAMHMRVGDYDAQWSDAAVRRLLRDVGDTFDDLVTLTQADKSAASPETPAVDLDALRAHVSRVKAQLSGRRITSPLDGREIIGLLGIEPGPRVGQIKKFLENQVIEGNLAPGDKETAADLVLRSFGGEGRLSDGNAKRRESQRD